MRQAAWLAMGFLVACGGSDEDLGTTDEALSDTGKVHVSRAADGGLVLAAGRPARVSSCQGGDACLDADGDGLVDAWEAVVLERLRPFVTFDEGEPLIDNKDSFASVARVTPFGQNHVLVNILLLYTRDYGAQNPLCFSASDHAGDVEHVAIDLEITGRGTAAVRSLFTTGHEGTEDDQSRLWKGADLHTLSFKTDPATGEPRWQVFASRKKHATYATKKQCESAHFKSLTHEFCLDEDCAPDDVSHPERFTRLPRVENAGEAEHHLGDDLGHLGFAGEHLWTEQRFCGGLTVSSRKDCPPSIASKLVGNPFL